MKVFNKSTVFSALMGFMALALNLMVQNFVSDNDELDTKFINANKVVSSMHYKTK